MSKHKEHTFKRIKKTHIWPAVMLNLFAAVILFMAVVAGMAFFISIVFQNKLDSSAEIMEKYNRVVSSQLKEGTDDAVYYATTLENLYSNLDTQTKIRSELLVLSKQADYEDVGLIQTDGKTVSTKESTQDMTKEVFYQETIKGKGGLYHSSSLKKLFFTAPVRQNGVVTGVLYLKADEQIELPESDQGIWEYQEEFCLIDSENQIVAYVGERPKDFSYEKIRKSGLLYSRGKTFFYKEIEIAGANHDRADAKDQAMEVSLQTGDSSESDLFNEDGFLSIGMWYENNLDQTELGTVGMRTMAYRTEVFEQFNLEQIIRIIMICGAVSCIPLFITVFFTITQIINNRKLTRILYYDASTGGNNFLYLKNAMIKMMKKRKYADREFAIAVFDVKKFRVFNDFHGHKQGNELLEKIYLYFRKNLRKKEIFARYAADQFCVVMIPEEGEDTVERINGMLKQLATVYPEEKISYSVGLYNDREHTADIERMISYAIVAVDTIKENHSSNISVFDEKMRMDLVREKEIEDLMEQALQKREFVVYLQPKYSVDKEKLSGAEALVRWISPEKGFVSPGEFIPTFEHNGFITKLDDYMISEVARIQRKWLDEGRKTVPVSVNVSRAHFGDSNLAEHIRDLVDLYKVPHNLIELELTESAFFDNKDTLQSIVSRLQEYGFVVSMDDFGTGFSSLNSLKDLPLDVIKLDGEFFRNTTNLERSQTVIQDTVGMAKHLDMKIVAEGIETKEQVNFLQEIGCDLIQGFYYARPMPVQDFEELSD